MREGRIVLCAFGAAAVLMIALPVGAILSRPAPVAADGALTGDISRLFLAAPDGAGQAAVGGLARVLPVGLPQGEAFDKLAASGFACEPDAGSAACFRPYRTAAGCSAEWRVRMTIDGAGHLSASDALSSTRCADLR